MKETDFLDEVEEKEPERTPFLSLLCIMTWVGSWFLAMYCLIWILRNGEVEDTQYYYFDSPMEYHLIKAGFFSSVISSVGVFFIWKLKRFGFFIYLFGQVLFGLFGLFVYLLVKPIDPPETWYFAAVFAGQLLFVPLYGIHWKIINSKR